MVQPMARGVQRVGLQTVFKALLLAAWSEALRAARFRVGPMPLRLMLRALWVLWGMRHVPRARRWAG